MLITTLLHNMFTIDIRKKKIKQNMEINVWFFYFFFIDSTSEREIVK